MFSNQQAANSAMNAAAGSQSVGQPQFHVNGDGGRNNSHNWSADGNVGAGTKVWESSNQKHAVGVGLNHHQRFGSDNGHSYKSRPDVGVGAAYRFNFGKK